MERDEYLYTLARNSLLEYLNTLARKSDSLNAKVRRRITRLITTLSQPPGPTNTLKTKNNAGASTSTSRKESAQGHSNSFSRPESLDDALNILRLSTRQAEVESVLNTLNVDDIKNSNIPHFKSILETLSEKEFINKLIRRRIKRLLFSLSSEEEKSAVKQIKKQRVEQPVTVKSSTRIGIHTRSGNIDIKSSAVVEEDKKSLDAKKVKFSIE